MYFQDAFWTTSTLRQKNKFQDQVNRKKCRVNTSHCIYKSRKLWQRYQNESIDPFHVHSNCVYAWVLKSAKKTVTALSHMNKQTVYLFNQKLHHDVEEEGDSRSMSWSPQPNQRESVSHDYDIHTRNKPKWCLTSRCNIVRGIRRREEYMYFECVTIFTSEGICFKLFLASLNFTDTGLLNFYLQHS